MILVFIASIYNVININMLLIIVDDLIIVDVSLVLIRLVC